MGKVREGRVQLGGFMTLHHAERDGTVGKALAVLDQIVEIGRPVRFAELLAASDYPKATLYRLIQTLTSQRMLAYDAERGTYTLGLRLVRMAHGAWAQSSIAPLARAHLDALSAAVGETVHLAQLDGAQVLYVDKRNAARPIAMFSDAGKVGPAYCTGVGKAMLAQLAPEQAEAVIAQQSFHRFTPQTLCTPEDLRAELGAIAARGHAYDREEHEPGIICIAAPILGETGRLFGALSVTSSTGRTSLSELDAHLPLLRDAAAAIARDLSTWRFPDRAPA